MASATAGNITGYKPTKIEGPKLDEIKEEILGLDDEANADVPQLKLISKDEQTFTLPRKYCLTSELVKTSLDTDKNATEIPIPGVDANILKEVVVYMNHHKGVQAPIIEKPLRSKIMKEVVKDEWDAIFIDEIAPDRLKLFALILAANYLDIKDLLHLGCACVASLIKGQPIEKIKGILQAGIDMSKHGSVVEAAALASASACSSSSSATSSSSSVPMDIMT